MFNKPTPLLAATLCTALFTTVTGTARASSFQILEQSPAHLGRAFAGTASQISDASTVFFNPAGMSQLDDRTVTVGGTLILAQSEFTDQGSNTGGEPGETDEPGFVPSLYLVQPLDDNWTFGFGINAPFGLASDYDEDWIGRYLATKSQLQLLNINATFAYEVSERLSLGAGLNYQHLDVTLESQIDSTLGVNPNPATDSSAIIEGDDDAIVADLSVYFRPVQGTRIGLLWRQGGEFSISGDATFIRSDLCIPGAGFPTGLPPAPTTGTLCAASLDAREGRVEADLELPDTLTLSASQSLGTNWSIHADIAWTQWSSIDTVEIIHTDNDVPVDTLELRYDDTMRYALGAAYDPGERWTWRAGVAWDEAPQTDPAFVTPRIPDEDRTWLSAGFNYALSDRLSIDVGYAHIFVEDTQINSLNPQTGNRVRGEFESSVNIIGAQANWYF